MPWEPIHAFDHTHKADTPKKQQLWSKVANEALKKHGDDARAIREANAVVAKIKNSA